MSLEPADVLMVGLGASAPMYYRVLLPAHELGIDYVGMVGQPPDARYRTGLVEGQSKMPDLTAYKLVVLQQPSGEGWLEIIRALQAKGTTVVYEVDDWLHAIKNRPDHDAREQFPNHVLAEYERCMKACDAMIVSTEFIARVYRHFNRRVFVCRNGIDPARYTLTRPSRETVGIGWAGATGHAKTIEPWLRATAQVMEEHPRTTFIAIGQPSLAKAFTPRFGARAVGVPFVAIEQYPAAMTLLDIGLAPGGRSGFYRAKSDLRFLEAGALGIPLVADPELYDEIEHGRSGFHARDAREARRYIDELVTDGALRSEMGEAARDHVLAHRTMSTAAEQWWDAFEAIVD